MAGIRNKEIQVQKPAQSLAHFQAKVASADDLETGLVKPLLIGGGTVLVLVIGYFAFSSWQTGRVERFEASRAELLKAIEGDPKVPAAAADYEKRLRENLPALDRLAKEAPGSRRAQAVAEAGSYHLMLEGKTGTATMVPSGSVGKVQSAARLIALGQGKEALDLLLPLRGKAKAGEPWADFYWVTLMDARRLTGDRAGALQDLSDYRKEFQGEGYIRLLERMAKGI
ncbi:MAG: hypothetical protein IPL96_13760 [Holophagaceae bacterium]|nr:hypothetical protein [Holophagaceae bacterium]